MSAGSKVAVLGFALLTGPVCARAEAPLETVTINTTSGSHRFKVEVMRTEQERERGLMYRKTMARDHGMLFEYQSEQPVTFWMHNTYLPLDLIFIGKDGRVVNVAHDAKPMDDSLIPSAGPALGVLELDAGTAETMNLKAGDVVHHKMFGDRGADHGTTAGIGDACLLLDAPVSTVPVRRARRSGCPLRRAMDPNTK